MSFGPAKATMWPRHRLALRLWAALLLGSAGNAPALGADRPGEAEDPVGVIHAATIVDGKVTSRSALPLPEAAMSTARIATQGRKADARTETAPAKIDPALTGRIAAARAGGRERVIVTFRDTVTMPRFPEPVMTESKDSAANRAARQRASEIVGQLSTARAAAYDRLATRLRERHGGEVQQTFWIANAVVVQLPLDQVTALARDPDVLYIEPDRTNARPPDADGLNDVDDGRRRIGSDPYFALNQTTGFIGLLDTGVRATHVLFNSPSHVSFREDCTDGICDGLPNPADDCWNHGTSSAAIITGNGRLGGAYRGVTGITLDSFKVYPAGCGGLSTVATLAAFQRAVAVLDRVIVAEMQGGGNEQSSISIAADNAFNAGAVVIAANGNNGPNSGTVNSPANAHKVLGVGNFDVKSLAQVASQSRGPTSDGRYKPDIQAPSNTETASSASNTALRVFTGTSGSTPYAAGAAALARNFLRGTAASIDPGQVYAYLILAGQQVYPFNNTSGAGRLVLPTGGSAWWGKVTVGPGGRIDIPLGIGAGSSNLDVALWWPESAAQAHNDIDLSLLTPGGATWSSSVSSPSVFERARAAGAVAAGTWKLRISGYSVPTGAQTVYWAAHVRR